MTVVQALEAGIASGRVRYDAAAGFWRVQSFDVARALLMDREFLFPPAAPLGELTLPAPIEAAVRRARAVQLRWFAVDPELHLKVRPVLAAALSGPSVARLEGRLRVQADAMLEAAVSARGTLRSFALEFPRRTQLDLLGVPAAARAAVIRSATLAAGLFPHRRTDPVRPLIAYASLLDVVAQALDAPAPEGAILLSAMQGAIEAGRIGREDAIAALSVTMIAGLETVGWALGGLLDRLATDEAARALVTADEASLTRLTEEAVRDTAGPQLVGCYGHDIVLGRTRIAAGTRFLVELRHANRDPVHFGDPDRFVADRTAGHIAFGVGLHICVGRHFARLHLRVAAQAFVAAFPRLIEACPQDVAALAKAPQAAA